ncbi:MAG TPA: hypothetical protein VF798_08780 [Burkholderiaceae bacterium]
MTTADLNLIFRRNYRADDTNPVQLACQWQIKRRLGASLEPGVQHYNAAGPFDAFDRRNAATFRLQAIIGF